MPFGLCYVPETFQMCMLSIFEEMIDKFVEVVMDDLTTYRDSFYQSLEHLKKILIRCEKTNLALNWKKMSFYGVIKNSLGTCRL